MTTIGGPDAKAAAKAVDTATATGVALTQNSFAPEKIALFRSLFRGRDDVYPRRFESRKTGRSGYQPACANEWARGVCEKPRVKCSVCPHQRFLAVTDEIVRWHLWGRDGAGRDFVMGVYPMLRDESCHFLAVDLDGDHWRDDAAAFLETCRRLAIPASRAPIGQPVPVMRNPIFVFSAFAAVNDPGRCTAQPGRGHAGNGMDRHLARPQGRVRRRVCAIPGTGFGVRGRRQRVTALRAEQCAAYRPRAVSCRSGHWESPRLSRRPGRHDGGPELPIADGLWRRARGRAYKPTTTALVWVYSSSTSWPISRPQPDCL
jgi:hypothetical protein